MTRIEVPYDHDINRTLELLRKPGLLLAASRPAGTAGPAAANVMTIGWGALGIIWGLPIFCVLVRPSRYTYSLIEASRAFSVNVPTGDMYDWVAFCGSRSGRQVDKFAERGMTYTASQVADTITIDGASQVYECRVVHHNDVIPAHLDPKVEASAYGGANYHRIYYGQVLRVTIKE